MSTNSSIEWTEATWNPVTGCDKVSAGCKFCYAERLSKRLQKMGLPQYVNSFELTLQPNMLEIPFKWKKPRKIFVNSMSDLFHKDIPLTYIKQVFKVMNDTPRHTYQILTKRSKRLLEVSNKVNWSKNIWIGVSVENQKYVNRLDDLRKVPAEVKFVSIEPLIGKIDSINFDGINWVIVGGESGPNARKIEKEWVIYLRDKCIKEKIPFFFKQWGGKNKKANGRELDGKIWNQYPKK